MRVVCRKLSIPEKTYGGATMNQTKERQEELKKKAKANRQVDFFIKTPKKKKPQKFEITLTGAGNPESQDKAAREMDVMVVGATTDSARKNLKKNCYVIVLEDGDVLKQFKKYFKSVGFNPKEKKETLAETCKKIGLK